MRKVLLISIIAILANLFPAKLSAESTIYVIFNPSFVQAPFDIYINGDQTFSIKEGVIRKVTTKETGRAIITYKLGVKYTADIILNLRENSVHYVKLYLPNLWVAVTKSRGQWIFKELSKKEGAEEIIKEGYISEKDYYYKAK